MLSRSDFSETRTEQRSTNAAIDSRRQQLDFERITFFYTNFVIGFFGIAIAVACLGIVVHQLYSPTVAWAWATLVMVTYIPRIVVSIKFARALKSNLITPANVRPWERYAYLSSIAPFACFALVIFLPYGEHTQTALLFCAVFVLALISGGSLAYSTAIGVLLIFLNFNMVALIARSLWEGGILLNTLAAALTVCYLLLTRLILRVSRAMIETISMKLDHAHQAFVDPLTKLWNRRRLHQFTADVAKAGGDASKVFCVIMFDIDHFKAYNDQFGHQAGDDVLVEVSRIIESCSAPEDIVIRYGGEEFLIILPTSTQKRAVELASQVIEKVRSSTEVTISAGIDSVVNTTDVNTIIGQADQALFAAKSAGRDTLKVVTNRKV